MPLNAKAWRPTLKLFRDTRGTVAVEFTLVAPLLFSLAFGTIEFGRYLQQHHIIVQGARDATRFLSRTQMTCAGNTDFCCPSSNVSWGIAEAAARNLAMRGSPDPSAPLLVNTWNDPATVSFSVNCIDNTSGAYLGNVAIPVVRTSISTPYEEFGLLSFIGLGPLDISVEHEEMNFGE